MPRPALSTEASTRLVIELGTGSAQSSESIFHITDFKCASASAAMPSLLRAPYGKRNSAARWGLMAFNKVSVPRISPFSLSPVCFDNCAWLKLWLPTA